MAEQSTQKGKDPSSRFQDEFNALPLDQKFSNLLQMEMATLNEAAKYVADSSMKILEKFGDALTDLGSKVEAEAKKATSANAAGSKAEKAEAEPKGKPSSKRRTSAKKAE